MIDSVLQERYRIESELGRGGMGVVYRAHDTLLKRDVAVKVLLASGLGTEGRARMMNVAQAAASLNHPNIVAVYDAGEIRGEGGDLLPFVVMELLDGPTLHEQRPDGIEGIVVIACQLCAALEYAHKHGIVHRDLKPENVMLVEGGRAGTQALSLREGD